MFLFLLLLVVVPVVEIAVFFQVASMIGVLDTLGVLLLFSIGGLLLVRHEGMGTMAKRRAELNEGRVPGSHLADGFWLLVAGLLLLVPGFVTDFAGFASFGGFALVQASSASFGITSPTTCPTAPSAAPSSSAERR